MKDYTFKCHVCGYYMATNDYKIFKNRKCSCPELSPREKFTQVYYPEGKFKEVKNVNVLPSK